MNITFSDINWSEHIATILAIAIPLALLQIILLLTAIISIARKDVPAQDKLIWILLSIFINIIGPIIYFAIGSKMLDEKAQTKNDNNETRW